MWGWENSVSDSVAVLAANRKRHQRAAAMMQVLGYFLIGSGKENVCAQALNMFLHACGCILIAPDLV